MAQPYCGERQGLMDIAGRKPQEVSHAPAGASPREEYARLVEAHYASAYAIALARLRDPEEAQDITQEGFLRAYALLDRLDDPSRFGPWIGTIVRNLAIDRLRRRQVRSRYVAAGHGVQEEAHRVAQDPREDLFARERHREARRHVEGLPENLREVILLRYMAGQTQVEVAQMTGMPRSTIASRERAALKLLRSSLDPVTGARVSPAAGSAVVAAVGALSAESRQALASDPVSQWLLNGTSAATSPFAVSGSKLAVGVLVLLAGGMGALVASRHFQNPGDRDLKSEAGRVLYSAQFPAAPSLPFPPGWIPSAAPAGSGAVSRWSGGRPQVQIASGLAELRKSGWMTTSPVHISRRQAGEGEIIRARFSVRSEPASDARVRPHLRFSLYDGTGAKTQLEVRGDSASLSSPADGPADYQLYHQPISIPVVRDHPDQFQILPVFESLGDDPGQGGVSTLSEVSIETHPVLDEDSMATVAVLKPASEDAGGLAARSPAEVEAFLLAPARIRSGHPEPDETARAGELPSYREGKEGITLDARSVPPGRIGLVRRTLTPLEKESGRPVQLLPDTLYRVRWHVTSEQVSEKNALLMLSARAAGTSRTTSLVLQGAHWSSSPLARTAAGQLLPGVGCEVGSGNGEESGGWYTLLLHTAARPGAPSGTLQLEAALWDSLSYTPLSHLEEGLYTVGAITVQRVP